MPAFSLVHFRIAVNESVGDSKEETIYMNVDGRGSHANYAKNVNLAKGDRVMVVGRLKQQERVEINGVKRTDVTVIPSTFSKLVRPVRTNPSDEKQGS
jgi:single-stranded DNA-binding protein